MKSGIDALNKNFTEKPPKNNEAHFHESHYSPETRQWVQKEVGSGENAGKTRVGNISRAIPEPEIGFQRHSTESPSKVGKLQSNFSRIKGKDDDQVFDSR